jgi:hypothetical protein
VLDLADEAARRGIPVDRVLSKRGDSTNLLRNSLSQAKTKNYGSINSRLASSEDSSASSTSISALEEEQKKGQSTSAAAVAAAVHDPAIRRTCLGLAVAYGGASGTLSGACLLLAKSGVELLVLTFEGDNQFLRWQSWFLLAVMLAVALLQLWYLNKSLRLADPTLVCPLAFCFYNTSSIMLGLMYFDQFGALSATRLTLVVVGIAVLLAGVWTVSRHESTSIGEEVKEEEQGLLAVSSEDVVFSPTSSEAPVEGADVTSALLANVGGIGGPHLPPIGTRSTLVDSPPLLDDNESRSTSPMSPRSSMSTTKGHARKRSRSNSIIAGLGMHVPGLPVQSVRFEGEDVDVEAGPSTSAHKNGQSSDIITNGKADSPTTLKKRRHFYETLLERGLSIGISPSSPGFNLRQSFEEEIDPTEAEVLLASRNLPRRTFSEADIDIVVAGREAEAAFDDDEISQQEQDRGGSGWARVIPAVEYQALSDRLNKLRHGTRGWFGGLFSKGD